MKKEKQGSRVGKFLMFAGGVVLTLAGFIVMPPLIEKCSNKMYKSSLKKEEIDFDSMGPEIVEHNEKEGE